MDWLEISLILALIVISISLGVLILLQQGRGADVGAAFGSGSANAVFGAQSTVSFITKVTTWLAIGFFAVSFGLAYAAKERAADIGNLSGLGDLPLPANQTPVSAPVIAGDDPVNAAPKPSAAVDGAPSAAGTGDIPAPADPATVDGGGSAPARVPTP